MKTMRILIVITFSLGLIVLGGCSYFKSGKKSAGGRVIEDTQTSGFSDEDGFAEYGSSAANRLKAPYNQTYRFEYDSVVVKQSDIESIEVQANYLVGHSKARVRLEGNTDDRGSREYNVTLGWQRAKAVASILKQYGVSNDQIAIVSFGKEKPIAFGHDEGSYRKNRRVALVYEAK